MTRYKIVIEYDGSKYKGWQRLKDSDKTIQEKIENLLTKLLNSKIEIHGSGRTDAGVHAYEQVAHFDISEEIEVKRLLEVSNEMLPQDIVFKSIEQVPENFHSRFSIKKKHYVYKIWNNEIPSALLRKYTYHVKEKLDIESMKRAIDYLVGEHDFTAFTANKSTKKSMVRALHQIEIKRSGQQMELHFIGEGFLYKMVRIITGTLIEVGLGQKTPEDVKRILENKDRQKAGETVPSHGLYLVDVTY